MIWWWAKDERGEDLMNAQEVYSSMQSIPERKKNNECEILIEAIQQWVAGVTAA
jgi:hypothetical protein